MRTAIILAAGVGRKIFPYDMRRQKAALPIANVPLVRRLVDDLRALPQVEEEAFLVAYGDVVTSAENLKALISRFQETGAEAAALVQPMGRQRGEPHRGRRWCNAPSGDGSGHGRSDE